MGGHYFCYIVVSSNLPNPTKYQHLTFYQSQTTFFCSVLSYKGHQISQYSDRLTSTEVLQLLLCWQGYLLVFYRKKDRVRIEITDTHTHKQEIQQCICTFVKTPCYYSAESSKSITHRPFFFNCFFFTLRLSHSLFGNAQYSCW